MSFFFEGNGYFSGSYLINSTTSNNIISASAISSSSINMLSTAGNYQNITNAAMPVNDNDVAIKLYVDNLGIRFNNITLTGTQQTSISSDYNGSFVITVTNLISNGPSATFHISKNEPTVCGHVIRHTLSPGTTTLTALNIKWPINSTPMISKSNNDYDGTYRIKLM